MTVEKLKEKLMLDAVVVPDSNREITGCYIGDLLSWVMGAAKTGDIWITIMSNTNIVAVAVLTDVSCIILCEDVALEEETLKKATEQEVAILKTPMSAFELAGKLENLV